MDKVLPRPFNLIDNTELLLFKNANGECGLENCDEMIIG
jgi:hypothetical protein